MATGITFLWQTVTADNSKIIIVPDDYQTIQEAIEAATEGDTIYIRAGTYIERVSIIQKDSISIIGEGANVTVIKGPFEAVPQCFDAVITIIHSHNILLKGFKIVPPESGGVEGGIYIVESSNCTITKNIITGFTVSCGSFACKGLSAAIKMEGATDNKIYENHISDNHVGIDLGATRAYSVYPTENNLIYRNNFVNNNDHVRGPTNNIFLKGRRVDVGLQKNFWDNGYEGNYWDDYAGEDSDGDGLGDTPYIIEEENIDHHPLVNPINFSWVRRAGEGASNYPPYITIALITTVIIAAIGICIFAARRSGFLKLRRKHSPKNLLHISM